MQGATFDRARSAVSGSEAPFVAITPALELVLVIPAVPGSVMLAPVVPVPVLIVPVPVMPVMLVPVSAPTRRRIRQSIPPATAAFTPSLLAIRERGALRQHRRPLAQTHLVQHGNPVTGAHFTPLEHVGLLQSRRL